MYFYVLKKVQGKGFEHQFTGYILSRGIIILVEIQEIS
jgi:hypothetical protein